MQQSQQICTPELLIMLRILPDVIINCFVPGPCSRSKQHVIVILSDGGYDEVDVLRS